MLFRRTGAAETPIYSARGENRVYNSHLKRGATGWAYPILGYVPELGRYLRVITKDLPLRALIAQHG
ncbi:hypothetical protein HRbin15_01004 [bacterium HR15]|nr:hypothetical protein HRbin15_01004 [bacterium HR15]